MHDEVEDRRQFLVALRQGRPEAWERYQVEHHPKVRELCGRMLRRWSIHCEGTADEVASEVSLLFLGKYVHRDSVMKTFPGYLHSMALTRASKFAARQHRHNSLSPEVVESSPYTQRPPPERWNPEAVALQRQMLEQLSQGLEELTDEEREILRLVYWEGLKKADVARALGCSKQNVGQRHDKLMNRLRAWLGVPPGEKTRRKKVPHDP